MNISKFTQKSPGSRSKYGKSWRMNMETSRLIRTFAVQSFDCGRQLDF